MWVSCGIKNIDKTGFKGRKNKKSYASRFLSLPTLPLSLTILPLPQSYLLLTQETHHHHYLPCVFEEGLN